MLSWKIEAENVKILAIYLFIGGENSCYINVNVHEKAED